MIGVRHDHHGHLASAWCELCGGTWRPPAQAAPVDQLAAANDWAVTHPCRPALPARTAVFAAEHALSPVAAASLRELGS